MAMSQVGTNGRLQTLLHNVCTYFKDLVQVLLLPYYTVELVIGSWSSIGPSQASLLDPLDDQLGVHHLDSFV